MKILSVLIEFGVRNLDKPFFYTYSGKDFVDIGFRVIVTFNKKSVVGYVLDIEETNKTIDVINKEKGIVLSEIDYVLDSNRILDDELILLSKKIAEYYLCSRIKVLQTMLPSSLKPTSSSLKAPKIKYKQYLVISSDDESCLTSKQIEILRLIKNEKKVLKRDCPSPSIWKKLIDLNRLKVVSEEISRSPFLQTFKEDKIILNDEQKAVIESFCNIDKKVFLLEGITGSGKTEVYLELASIYLKKEKSVLILVPEISLTPMMVSRFLNRFKENVAILHSELTKAQKYDEYRKISSGKCKIVVGARSAIFAPLKNLGLIIIDEEHSESYKQDVSPYYHAREVAIFRSEIINSKVLLASATPSLETRARADKGVYGYLTLSKRANSISLPQTKIINLADLKNIDRNSSIFSITLKEEIAKTLKRKEQVILLINRRGFSTSVICRKCGHVFKCPECHIPLVYHKNDQMLKCHHCGYVEPYVGKCSNCQSNQLMTLGFGSQRIEEEIKRLFPDARTLRLDSDSARIKHNIPKIIESFVDQKADILIGTQMVSKGHNFPNVTLVGLVLADTGLSIPSFRSTERVFQLITQSIGRSGRKLKQGKAIIQTYQPEHYAILLGAQQNYSIFYKKEMGMRKFGKYPPYYYLASVILSGTNEDKVVDSAKKLVYILKEMFSSKGIILGPCNPFFNYKDKFRRDIIVKFKDIIFAREIFKVILKNSSSISIDINIDPMDL